MNTNFEKSWAITNNFYFDSRAKYLTVSMSDISRGSKLEDYEIVDGKLIYHSPSVDLIRRRFENLQASRSHKSNPNLSLLSPVSVKQMVNSYTNRLFYNLTLLLSLSSFLKEKLFTAFFNYILFFGHFCGKFDYFQYMCNIFQTNEYF